jgi:hypothetical protein
VLSNTAAQRGATPILNEILDGAAAVGEGAAITAAARGALAAGTPLSWLGVAAFLAPTLIGAGTQYLLSQDGGTAVQGDGNGQGHISSSAGNSFTLGPGSTEWVCSFGSAVGISPDEISAGYIATNATQYGPVTGSCTISGVHVHCEVSSGAVHAIDTSCTQAAMSPNQPSITCAGSGVVGNGTMGQTPYSCSSARGVPNSPLPLVQTPSQIPQADHSKQVNPQVLADLLNNIINNCCVSTQNGGGGLGPSGSQVFTSRNPVTAWDVQSMEDQENFHPTLDQMMEPAGPGSVTVLQPDGTMGPSSLPQPDDGSKAGGELPDSTQAKQNAQPLCGNLEAGQPPCGIFADSPAPEDMGQDIVSKVPNTMFPDVVTQTMPKPQDFIDPVANPPRTIGSGDPILPPGPIHLPFDMWPQVFPSLVSAPSINGECPTVTFHSIVLKNRDFVVDKHCYVFDQTYAVMAAIAGPTYLLFGLIAIMKA